MKTVLLSGILLIIGSAGNAATVTNQLECFLDVKDQMFEFQVTKTDPMMIVMEANGGAYKARLLEDDTSYSLEVKVGNGPQVVRTGMLSEMSKNKYAYILYFKNANGDDEADIRCNLK
ncbi:MAG: hypothetical protein ACXVA9_01885 [Bdellovibrionales bacterium]